MPELAHWSYSLRNKLIAMVLIVVVLGGILSRSADFAVHAQAEGGEWSTPILLFDAEGQGNIFLPSVVADQSGRVHVFWNLVLAEDDDQSFYSLLYYTRWDGTAWTDPIDVLASPSATAPSAAVDLSGNIHLIWHGPGDLLFYSQAPGGGTNSAHSWTSPIVIEETNIRSRIAIDSSGRLHLVYPRRDSLGLYYRRSEDRGATWSLPVNISQTSRFDSSADFVRLAISDSGTIHVVWTEFQLPFGWPPIGLFYSNSTDGGQTWLEPIELVSEGYNQVNVAVVDDDVVHVVWNGMAGVHGRYHRWSSDSGRTWSKTFKLNTAGVEGSTGPPPLVVDSEGTLHLLMTDADTSGADCVLYSSWQNQSWTTPTCISGEEAGASDFIEEPTMVISEGNNLQAVFWDDRQRLWYTTKQTAAPTVPPVPIPTETSKPTRSIKLPTPSRTPAPTPTPRPTRVVPLNEKMDESSPPNPGEPVFLAMVPVVVLISSIILIRTVSHRKH